MFYTHQEIRLIGGEFYSSNRYATLPKHRLIWRAENKQLFNEGTETEQPDNLTLERVDHEILLNKIGSIFLQLNQFPQWVCWRYVERDGKPTKPPINPHNGSYANHSDSSTWGTWREAYNSYKRNGYNGIGFVFTANDPFTGVDIDDCLDGDGQMLPVAQDIVTRLNSYTEVSPSGKGVKIWVVGTVPEGRKVQLSGGCSIEFYSRERYFTITGKHWAGTPQVAMDAQNALIDIYNSFTAPKQSPLAGGLLDRFHLSAEMVNLANTTPVAPHRSQDDFRLIVALVGRGASDNEIIEVFQSYPIGQGKYKTNGEKYLATSIKNARLKHKGGINPPNNTPKPNGQLHPPQPIERIEPKKDIDTKNPKTADFLAGFNTCGFNFRLNLLDDSVECNGEAMSNVLKSVILSRMRDIGLNQRDWVKDAMVFAANQNRYHPVKELFDSLVWDGTDYIRQFVGNYLTESTGMGETAFRRWLVGAVAKVYENAQNFMLVWDGPQDVGKSSLARWLCPWPRYFIEGGIKPENKDSYLRLCTYLVWEVGELQAVTRKADKEALKDFITRQVVTERPSYGEFDIVKPAMASLIGTINEDGAGFLNDPTGNRRFLVINIRKIDFAYRQEFDPANLWRQAVALYKAGESGQLTPEEKAKQKEINQAYEMESVLSSFFFDSYQVDPGSNRFTPVTEILQTLELAGLRGSQDANAKELARLMKRLNLPPVRSSTGTRARGYRGIVKYGDVIPV